MESQNKQLRSIMEIIKVSAHSLLTIKLPWETMSFNILKNFNFYIAENIFIGVRVKKLNNILRINGYTKIDKDNKINELQFNKEKDDGLMMIKLKKMMILDENNLK
jgi:hypothetical protein